MMKKLADRYCFENTELWDKVVKAFKSTPTKSSNLEKELKKIMLSSVNKR